MQMLGYALLVILALSTPAVAKYRWNVFPMQGNAADNAAYAYNGTVANGTVNNGNVYISCGHGLDGNGPVETKPPYIQSFNVPAGNVKFAHMYIAVWHGTENYQGKLKLDYTNATGTYTLAANGTIAGNLTLGGVADTNDNVWCTSHGVTWAWYDVKDYVTTGDNSATARTYKICPGFDGRVQSIKLIVVYENASESQVRYWINQGHDTLAKSTSGHPAKDYGYSYFNGSIDKDNWDYAMLYCTWYAGDQGDHDTLWFNGNLLDDSCTNYEQGTYLDTRWYVVKNDTIDYLEAIDNYAKYYRDTDEYVHWIDADLVLFKEAPRPDLVVDSLADPALVDHDSTHGYVVGHNYTINATIMNQGKLLSNACQAALYEQNTSGRFLVDTTNLGSIDAGGSFVTVTFDWHSYVNETVTLEVVADYLDAVNESAEGNNASTMNVNVLDAGNPDLDMTVTEDDLAFLPTWNSNDTTIKITVTNLGKGDANDFVVKAYHGSTLIHTSSSMSVAAKGDKVINFTYSALYGGPYLIRAVLDANGIVTESNEGNNETTKQLNVIEVMLWDSHHHGNISTYNGVYSKNNDVEMFKVTKLVPENTTPWDALNSEAHGSLNNWIGIDGLIGSTDGQIYWYLYFNGRYVPKDSFDVIKLQDGETMHWDFQKQVYTANDSFTPPCTVQSYPAGDDLYPEPFTHGFPMNLISGDGYSRTVWDTVIVYPAGSSDFASIAGDIKDTLVAGGVPTGQIVITSDTTVTDDQKNNSNLILIGNYKANSLIEEVNALHENIGMPVYFNYTSCEIVEDNDTQRTPYDPVTYDHGGVVEAFDNQWNNKASVGEPGSIVLMASGLNDCDAKDAANMLIGETDELNEFWVVHVPVCGDVTGEGDVNFFDAARLRYYVGFPGQHTVDSLWAAEVTDEGTINFFDAARLRYYVGFPGQHTLECQCNC